MPPFSGSSAAVLEHAVGTWTLAGPTMAKFSVGDLRKRVNGTIPVSSAHFEVRENASVGDAHAVLDIASIDTGIAKRDSDLRKPALLDLGTHPQLSFASTVVTAAEQGWMVSGLLTAKGTTREIVLDVTADSQSDDTVRLRLIGQLDRKDFRIRAPRFLIGRVVDIEIEATFSRQPGLRSRRGCRGVADRCE